MRSRLLEILTQHRQHGQLWLCIPSQWSDAQSHVGTQHHAAVEAFLGEHSRLFIAHEQGEIAVAIDDARGFIRPFLRLVMNRLGKLNHGPAGPALKNAFTKILMRDPDVAEVAAAVNEDRPARRACIELGVREVVHGRDVSRTAYLATHQVGPFAQPDRRVAHVADIREVDDRERFARDEFIQTCMNPGLEIGNQLERCHEHFILCESLRRAIRRAVHRKTPSLLRHPRVAAARDSSRSGADGEWSGG